MATLSDVIAAALAHGLKVKPFEGGANIQCPMPGHEDRNPSCTVKEGRNGTLLIRCGKCGDIFEEALRVLGLHASQKTKRSKTSRSTSDSKVRKTAEAPRPAKSWTFEYRDWNGKLRHLKRREERPGEEKKLWFLHTDGVTKRKPKEVLKVPYRAENLRYADGSLVHIFESEKTVEVLHERVPNVVALATGGCNHWSEDWAERIKQANPKGVVLWADNDGPGEKWRDQIAGSLAKLDVTVWHHQFSKEAESYGLEDWLVGKDEDEFHALVESLPRFSEELPREVADVLSKLQPISAIELLRNPQKYVVREPWLFRGVIARGYGGIVFADSEAGKTWIGLDAAISAATGVDFLQFFRTERTGPVVAITEEDDASSVHSRIQCLLNGRGERFEDHAEALAHMYLYPMQGFSLSDARFRQALEIIVKEKRPILVIIDTLREVFAGNLKNDDELADFLSMFRPMAKRHDCFVLLTHHTRKDFQGQSSDPTQSGVGSYYLKSWCDSGLWLKPVKGATDQLVVTTKQRFNNPEQPAIRKFCLTRSWDQEEDAVTWSVTEGEDAALVAGADASRILEILESHGGTMLNARLKEESCLNNERFKRATGALESLDKLRRESVKENDKNGRLRDQIRWWLTEREASSAASAQGVDQGTSGDNQGTDPFVPP